MKNTKKALLFVLALAGVTAGLCGCGKEAAKQKETAENAVSGFTPRLDQDAEMTLSVVGDFRNFEAVEQVADAFRAYYPGIEVVYTGMLDYYTDLKNRLATGKEIDIYMNNWMTINNNNDRGFVYENAENLKDADLDTENLNPNYLRYATKDDVLYGLPIYLQNHGLLVNKDILKECGLEIPDDYQEFLDCCAELKKAGYETPILAYEDNYGKLFINSYMERLQNGASEDEALEETLTQAEEYEALGYIHPDSATLEDGYNAMILRFFQGDIPFAATNLGSYSGTKKREAKSEEYTEHPFAYDYISAPVTEKENLAYMSHFNMVYLQVFRGSEHLDYANEFLRFLSTEDSMKILAEMKNNPTACDATLQDFPYLEKAEKLYAPQDGGIYTEEPAAEGLAAYRPGAKNNRAVVEEVFNRFRTDEN